MPNIIKPYIKHEDLAKIAKEAPIVAETTEEKEKRKRTKKDTPLIISTIDISDPENYITLEGKTHGTGADAYEYPDMLVAMHRLGFNQDVGKAAEQLGISVGNTAKEYSGSGPDYIGNIKWKQALMLNLTLNGETLSPRQFIDFLKLLESGKAFDGEGNKIRESRLSQILEEIVAVRKPWRAEWLDADFKIFNAQGKIAKEGELYLLTKHIIQGSELIPQYRANIEGKYLNSNSQIDKNSFNEYGLAVRAGTDFYQWYPRTDNNSVAGFGAYSVRAVLNCDWGPDYSFASLGVRLARKKI